MIRIYDVKLDVMREATQDDVEDLQRCANAFGQAVAYMRKHKWYIAAEVVVMAAQGRISLDDSRKLLELK